MFTAIRHNLTHLGQFEGRDARQTFWFYVLFLVLINIALSFVISIPIVGATMKVGIQAAQQGLKPDQVGVEVLRSISGWIGISMWFSIALGLAMIALLAAAFVRRVHDTGNSGWWAVVPIVAKLCAMALNVSATMTLIDTIAHAADAASLQAAMAQNSEMLPYGFLTWIGPVVVVVFGLLPSTPGANRYGGEPDED